MNLPERKLRVGVALESIEVPAWQFAILESVVTSDCAEITQLILKRDAHKHPSHDVVYKAFNRLERQNPRTNGAAACKPVSAASLLKTAERITLPPSPGGQADVSFVQYLRARGLDVLVALVDPALLPSDKPLAQFGTWYFDVDGRPLLPADGSLVGFTELIHRRSHVATSLQVRLAGETTKRTAFHTCSAIDYLSHEVTRSEHLWKCSTFVLRSLRACHEMGGHEFINALQLAPDVDRRRDSALSRAFSALVLQLGFLRYLLWRVRKKIGRVLFGERWILLYSSRGRSPGHSDFTKLTPPAGRFWADPHAIARDGVHYVFFEDASLQNNFGHISMMSNGGEQRFTAPKAVIRRPYHLSYPFVFEWRGDYYLIPESASNRTIELYRCTRFPDEWEYRYNLMEGISAYDATLVEYQGRWWMFAGVKAREGASTWDELCIFHAASPVSRNWQAHKGNPVISDVRRARPAGPLFVDGDQLIRPSQDCSGRYGRALNLNRVLQLDDQRYAEVLVNKFEPDWDRSILAIHSYSRSGAMTFIDAIHRERKLRARS